MKRRVEVALHNIPELDDRNAISAKTFSTWFKRDILLINE